MKLEEIARLSGVSRSTVSRVINDDPRVSPVTRDRVTEVIQRLNYEPNVVARSLAGGRTRILGLVIPMGVTRLFVDPFFPLLIQGVSQACNARDHSVMLWIAEPEYERRTIRQILYSKLIDGVIIASMLSDDPLVQALVEGDLPFILIGRHPLYPQVSYVDMENYSSARQLTLYLFEIGYRRVASICGPQNMIGGIDRLAGFRAAFQERGSNPDPDLIVAGDFTEESGYQAMQRLLPHRPEAVFAASDAMAAGALRALHEAKIRIPEDIAVVGYDDVPFAARTDPPLTTIRQPIQLAGTVAAETLIEMIRLPDPNPRQIVLPTELVIRSSCGFGLK
jgi:LacI family transcriptional regulator